MIGKIENYYMIISYVFVFVVISVFNNKSSFRVMNGKLFSSNILNKGLVGSSFEEVDVIDDDIFFSFEWRRFGRINDKFIFRKIFVNIIVGVIFKFNGDIGSKESIERLICRIFYIDVDSVMGKIFFIILFRNVVRKGCF